MRSMVEDTGEDTGVASGVARRYIYDPLRSHGSGWVVPTGPLGPVRVGRQESSQKVAKTC